MGWNTEAVLTWMLLNAVLGTLWLALDHKLGEKIYRFGYNFSHRDPLPEGEDIGFLHGELTLEHKFQRSFYLAVLQFFFYWHNSKESFMTYLIFFITSTPMLFAGLCFGEYLGSPFELVRKFRSGEIQATARRHLNSLRRYLPELSFLADTRQTKKEVRSAPKVPKAETDPYELIRKYTEEKKEE